MFNLFRKTMYDKRIFIIGWSLGLIILALLMILFFPAFKNFGFDQLLAGLPPELKSIKGLIGNLDSLKTISGYLGGQFFDIRMPMFISVFSIILAVGLSIKDEEDGYLRILLALPMSRIKLLFGKLFAIVTICLIATIATIAGLWIGIALIGETFDWIVIFNLSFMMFLLSVCMTTLFYCIGLASGKRGLTMGLGIIVAAGSFLLTTFAKSVDWLQPYEKISLFHYFPPAEIIQNGISLSDVVVLSGITIISIIFAIIFFRRRDVR